MWRFAVCARKPHLAYYLKMQAVPFPLVDQYDELIALCRGRGADFLFYGPSEAKTRPGFKDLLDAHRAYPGPEPVVALDDPRRSCPASQVRQRTGRPSSHPRAGRRPRPVGGGTG